MDVLADNLPKSANKRLISLADKVNKQGIYSQPVHFLHQERVLYIGE